jgi:hypothetical protein
MCRNGLAAAGQVKGAGAPAKHKFQAPCEMTCEEMFGFAYGESFIPMMKAMAAEVGREKLVAMLKRASCAVAEHATRDQLKKNPKNDFATFAAELRKPNPFYERTTTSALVEDTPTSVGFRITECLWAKTFRAADAADIGYVTCCYPDVAAAPVFNPKMKLILTKTLMQGHDCCNPRWVMES